MSIPNTNHEGQQDGRDGVLALPCAQEAIIKLHFWWSRHGDTRGMCRIPATPCNAVAAPWSKRKVRCLVHSPLLLRGFVHCSVRDNRPRNLRVVLVVVLLWFRIVTTFCCCFCISCSSYVQMSRPGSCPLKQILGPMFGPFFFFTQTLEFLRLLRPVFCL